MMLPVTPSTPTIVVSTCRHAVRWAYNDCVNDRLLTMRTDAKDTNLYVTDLSVDGFCNNRVLPKMANQCFVNGGILLC
jgi:hypothetical protein